MVLYPPNSLRNKFSSLYPPVPPLITVFGRTLQDSLATGNEHRAPNVPHLPEFNYQHPGTQNSQGTHQRQDSQGNQSSLSGSHSSNSSRSSRNTSKSTPHSGRAQIDKRRSVTSSSNKNPRHREHQGNSHHGNQAPRTLSYQQNMVYQPPQQPLQDGNNPPPLQGEAQTTARILYLTQRNAQLVQEVVAEKQRKRGKKGKQVKEMKDLIYQTVKNTAWRTTKFVTSQAQEVRLANLVFDNLGMEEYADVNDPTLPARRETWMETYQEYCLTCLNSVRTYIIGQMKKVCFAYMDDHNGNMPVLDDVFDCTRRTCNLTRSIWTEGTADEDTLVRWYFDELLPRTTGNTNHWSESKRFFTPCSECTMVEPPFAGKLYLTPSTEAFALIVMDGYRVVWQKQFKQKREEGRNSKIKTPRVKAGMELSADDKEWRCKYTDMDNGQSRYGGWNTEGITKFARHLKGIKESRAMARNVTAETRIMVAIRGYHGVTQTNLRDYDLSRKKRQRDSTAVQREPIETCFDDDE